MIFNVMTLFPDFYKQFLETSIIARAIKNNKIIVNLYNIRNYSMLKSKSVDDYVYGGGEGMLMMAEPICRCYSDIVKNKKIKTIYMSPKGKLLNNDIVKQLSNYDELVVLCGHYEGVDERALEIINAEELSIGDYVLTGGEIPSMVLIDTVSRYVPGVLSSEECYINESLYSNLLECPQYTRPVDYMGKVVPEVLLSGDHKKIANWRLEKSIELTKNNRPDLYKKYLENNNGGNHERDY